MQEVRITGLSICLTANPGQVSPILGPYFHVNMRTVSALVCYSVRSVQMVSEDITTHVSLSYTNVEKWTGKMVAQWAMALVGKPDNLALLTRPVHCTSCK